MEKIVKGQIWKNNETSSEKEINFVEKFKVWFSDGTYIQKGSLVKYYTLLF